MSGLSGALCRGLGWLFESMDDRCHQEARKICAECPAIAACQAELERVISLTGAVTQGGPSGTWAGQLIGKGGLQTRRRAIRAACGTDSGYFRHRKRGEAPCEDCTTAHRVAGRQWRRR